MKRGNLDVRTHAHVTTIIFEGKRAVGVRYLKGGRGGTPTEVRANKEVILSGGTYNRRRCCNCPASARRSCAVARH